MGIIIKPNAVNTIVKGKLLFAEGQPIEYVFALMKGKVLLENKEMRIMFGAGSFLGVADLSKDTYMTSCVAAEDVTVFAFQLDKKEALLKILEVNKDYRGLMAGALSKYVNDLANLMDLFYAEADKLYQFVKMQFKLYTEAGKAEGIRTNIMPAVTELQPPKLNVLHKPERLSYYRECAKIPLEIQKGFYSYGNEIAFCHIEEQIKLIAELMEACQIQRDYIIEVFHILFHEGEQNLYLNIAKLAFDLQAAEKDYKEAVHFLECVAVCISSVEKLISEKTNTHPTVDKVRMQNIYQAVISNQASEYGVGVSELDVAGQYVGSFQQILGYSCLAAEETADFEEAMEQFIALPDKLAVEDIHRKLRKRIAEGFFKVYEAVFLKAYEDGAVLPRAVELFLNFGFIDERLITNTQLLDLHAIVIQPVTETPCPVYTIREWLTAVYEGKKEPSKNEFDLEYVEMLREMKKNGQINAKQEAEQAKDQKLKLKYEVQNMFRYNLRLIHGQITTFVPVLHADMFGNSAERALVAKSAVNESIKKLRSVDFSLFARELMYINKELNIEKEYCIKEVFPDIILMPTYGTQASMWQDISCKHRDLPGRFLLPIFTDVNLDDLIIRTCGKYRWELCRSVQGMAWNSIQYKSLTSEYYDYLLYFKKNKELSEERKEKIKQQMQRGKNNYREVFAMDYETWIKSEASGAMKLNKVVREIMATYCPFEKGIRMQLQMQPAFEEAMARQKREFSKKAKEVELHFRTLTKDGIELPDELIQTLAYYEEN